MILKKGEMISISLSKVKQPSWLEMKLDPNDKLKSSEQLVRDICYKTNKGGKQK